MPRHDYIVVIIHAKFRFLITIVVLSLVFLAALAVMGIAFWYLGLSRGFKTAIILPIWLAEVDMLPTRAKSLIGTTGLNFRL